MVRKEKKKVFEAEDDESARQQLVVCHGLET